MESDGFIADRSATVALFSCGANSVVDVKWWALYSKSPSSSFLLFVVRPLPKTGACMPNKETLPPSRKPTPVLYAALGYFALCSVLVFLLFVGTLITVKDSLW